METKVNIDKLHKKIKESGMSIRQLAIKTGMSEPHLSMMFKGKRNMSVRKLNKILEIAQIDIKDISE